MSATTIEETAGRGGVHALNFFTAAMQTGFGPFVSVWLVSQGWSLTDVGIALSIGTATALAGQIPGGLLIDFVHHKRDVAAVALAVIAIAALTIGAAPSVHAVWAAEILHSIGSVLITPAIAALTLTLCGHDSFSDRLGGNARHASIGAALAAALFGLVANHMGERAIFWLTAALALPATASLLSIRPGPCPPTQDDHMALAHPSDRETMPWSIFKDPYLHLFAFCVLLFQLGNAALLPLALGGMSQRGAAPAWLVPAAIVVPQLAVALASPKAGALARILGRKQVLLAGFAALPVRALLFSATPSPEALIAFQVLDGISATVMGLMLPLVAADLTSRTGHLNLAMGSFGLAAGIGATLSTTGAGWIADRLGQPAAFQALALAGALAVALIWTAMPETKPGPDAEGQTA